MRWAEAGVGGWVFASGFVWHHAPEQRLNAWIVGALVVVVSFVARAWRPVRFVNTLLAVWLLVSVYAVPGATGATALTGMFTALVLFVLSLMGGEP